MSTKHRPPRVLHHGRDREVREAVAAERARVLRLLDDCVIHEYGCRDLSHSPLEFSGCNCRAREVRAAIESGHGQEEK